MRNNVCARKVKSQKQNIMKQFDLDEYLANPSRKVVTRDGRNITRFLCTDARGLFPIVALVENDDGEYAVSYTKDGRFFPNEIDDKNDLFFAPEKYEGWVNIYKAAVPRNTLGCMVTRYVGSSIWPTEEAAKTAADAEDIVTIKIEWEE